MKLDKKKNIAAKVFGVGKEKIVFLEPRLEEIKEAITKEDIRNLKQDGAIVIKDKKGRRSNKKGSTRKSPGNIRKYIVRRKRDYLTLTRKLRKYVAELAKQGLLSKENVKELRKKIRNRDFKSKAQLKENIKSLTR